MGKRRYGVFNLCISHVHPHHYIPPPHAQLTTLQQDFIEYLLNQATFQKHLCAVKEINTMLTRGEHSGSAATLHSAITWLRTRFIVQRLLRSNLHQKQYVAQVQHVLAFLSRQQCLQEEDLDLLWGVTEKVCGGGVCCGVV